MRAIIQSMIPFWCDMIASNQKTIELRKTKPDITLPVKIYIYESKSKNYIRKGRGKIIGEYICDKIDAIRVSANNAIPDFDKLNLSASLVPPEIIADYIKPGKTGYAYHITNLKIYDNPRNINDFNNSKHEKITRAPQSWCFTEE